MEIEVKAAAAPQPERRNPGDDLQHIEGLLALGQALPPYRPPGNRNRRWQRAQRGRSPLQQRQASRSAQSRSHSQPAVASRRERSSNEQGGSSGAGPSRSSSSDDEGPSRQQDWNRPGPQSTAKAWHCEACDCWVLKRGEPEHVSEGPSRRNIMQRPPSGSTAEWRKHVAGIRHQRQALSIRETGIPGELLISTFETVPAREVQRFQRASNARPEIEEELAALRVTALKELIHHTGATAEYHRLAERFSHERLQDACDMLLRSCFPRRFFGQLSCNSVDGPVYKLGTDPAMLAILAHALASGKSRLEQLELDVLTTHASDAPASMAAVTLLADSLASSQVVRLKLSLQCWTEAGHVPERQLRKILETLRSALERNCGLRRLELSLPAWFNVPHELIESMKTGAQAARQKARLALVMGLHPRLGSKSPMSLLPYPILRIILDKAAPLT